VKCPLLLLAALTHDERDYATEVLCQEAMCAWWDDTLRLCSVRVIAQFAIGAGVNIHNIAENMPFKAQL